jgi:large subunit ribosomal protein L18
MDTYLIKRNERRKKRALRVRKHVRGSGEIPRLSVHKSNQHLFVQLIDDEQGLTLAGIGTMSKDLAKGKKSLRKSRDHAKEVGTKIAQLAKEKNINTVIFDRGRYKYHGLIADLANAAREAGLKF